MASLRFSVYGADRSGQSWRHCAPFPDLHEAELAAEAFTDTQGPHVSRVFFVVDEETGEIA